jgi:peptide/nickel transport system substrate-binding protein
MSKKFFKYGWLAIGILLLVALVIFPACAPEGEGGNAIPYKNDGIFVQETIGNIDSLDPAWAYDTASGEQITYMYQTLIRFDGTSTDAYEGVLADSWGINGTDVTFHIRSDATFSNGDPVTPEDVEYSIERALVEDRAGGPIWMLYSPLMGLGGSRSGGVLQVTGTQIDNTVDVSGDDVTFHLGGGAAWAPQFMQIMTGTWASIVDKSWCVAGGDWDGDLSGSGWEAYNNPLEEASPMYDDAMGSGPWELSNNDPGVSITLAKVSTYWNESTEPVPFDNVVTKFVDEWSTRKTDFINGDADQVYVPRQYIHQLDDYTGYTGGLVCNYPLPTLAADAFFFNFNITTPTPYIGSGALDGDGIPYDFFQDLNVREGFAQAFDYDTFITDAYLGEAQRLGSPIVEGLPYYNPSASMWDFDPDAANASLNLAYGGTLATTGFEFTLTYNSGNVARQTACTLLANELVTLNPLYKINIQPVLWSTFLGAMVDGTLPMFSIGWTVDYPDPDDFAVPFQASWGTFSEWQSYNNTEVDALIIAGESTTVPSERQDIYYQLQELYYTDVPGIMLQQATGRAWFTPYISGYYYNPTIPGTPGPLWLMSKSES